MPKKVIFIAIALVVIVVGFLLYQKRSQNVPTQSETSNASNSLSPYSTLTGVTWSNPQAATEQNVYGDITGEKTTSTLSGEPTTVMNFENKELLSSQGYTMDVNLSADGPGSSMWGYSKTENGEKQIIVFSYETEPSSSNPNEPLQFNCPCKINVSIFLSNPFTENK